MGGIERGDWFNEIRKGLVCWRSKWDYIKWYDGIKGIKNWIPREGLTEAEVVEAILEGARGQRKVKTGLILVALR